MVDNGGNPTVALPLDVSAGMITVTAPASQLGYLGNGINAIYIDRGTSWPGPYYMVIAELKIGNRILFSQYENNLTLGNIRGAARTAWVIDDVVTGGAPGLVYYISASHPQWKPATQMVLRNRNFEVELLFPSSSDQVSITYSVHTAIPNGKSIPLPEIGTVDHDWQPEPMPTRDAVPTYDPYAFSYFAQDIMTGWGLMDAYMDFTDAIIARQATITKEDIGVDSDANFLRVVQCFMNYNSGLRGFIYTGADPTTGRAEVPSVAMSSFTPQYRYPVSGTGSHVSRYNAFKAKVDNLLTRFCPIGSNPMDSMFAAHLYSTTNNIKYQSINGLYTPSMPYQSAYMGLMGVAGNGPGIGTCCGHAETDTFLLRQCGLEADLILTYPNGATDGSYNNLNINSPVHTNGTAVTGGHHGATSIKWRGKIYLMDSSEGEAFSEYNNGDLLLFLGTEKDLLQSNARVQAGNRCFAPFEEPNSAGTPSHYTNYKAGPMAHKAVNTDYDMLRGQAIVSGKTYLVTQDFATHTITIPKVVGNTGAIYNYIFSTEYEDIIEIKVRP